MIKNFLIRIYIINYTRKSLLYCHFMIIFARYLPKQDDKNRVSPRIWAHNRDTYQPFLPADSISHNIHRNGSDCQTTQYRPRHRNK